MGPTAFVEKITRGEGENKIVTEETDYKKYVDISAKIAGELSGLLVKLEEGFAVVNIAGEEVREDESSALRDWQMQRENN
jgi:aspartokinase